jgi:heme ABC exporter ATP-binding subunit CcmA
VASGPVIHLRSAVALLGSFPALAGVDFDVDAGEVVLVKGANGAGKSTLLRACAGLVEVVSGEAVILGCDVIADRRSVRRRVGMIGHASFLYDDLSVTDNLRFAVRAAGGSLTAVAPAMETLGLAGRLAKVDVGRLSAGQRRRVALAALLARDPELWLLDEPHAGLDAEGRELLDGLIADRAARGTTVVLASHELDRAGALAGRVVTVAGGMLYPALTDVAGPGVRPEPHVAPPHVA